MIPSYDDLEFFSDREERINKLDKELFRIQNKLRNVLESFIEVLELREKDLGDEKKQKSKKSNKK